jgi:hypothetical protein
MRERLPNRRASETFMFEVANLHYHCTFSRTTDGRVLEIFLSNTKPSSQSDANAKDSAIAASLALQFGCELATLQHAILRDARGHASTPLGVAIDLIVKQEEEQR